MINREKKNCTRIFQHYNFFDIQPSCIVEKCNFSLTAESSCNAQSHGGRVLVAPKGNGQLSSCSLNKGIHLAVQKTYQRICLFTSK